MRNGFTLVELIVVIAIIGLLATVGVSSYTNILNKSKITKAEADVKEFVQAIKVEQIQTGTWINGANGSSNISSTATWNAAATGLVPTYLESVPNDPWGSAYFYDGAPDTECGAGANSVCSAGKNGTFESHNRADTTAQGDDICTYIPSDC
ncbi:type II secretion system protein GspG [Candidatus Woesebacteria bacterium]|nr:type II secretion system protein GspG [Candidatus Woesebacteria bacterium]